MILCDLCQQRSRYENKVGPTKLDISRDIISLFSDKNDMCDKCIRLLTEYIKFFFENNGAVEVKGIRGDRWSFR